MASQFCPYSGRLVHRINLVLISLAHNVFIDVLGHNAGASETRSIVRPIAQPILMREE